MQTGGIEPSSGPLSSPLVLKGLGGGRAETSSCIGGLRRSLAQRASLQFGPNVNVVKTTHCSPSEGQRWALKCPTGGLLACLTGVAGATPWPLPSRPRDSCLAVPLPPGGQAAQRHQPREGGREGREKGNWGSAAPSDGSASLSCVAEAPQASRRASAVTADCLLELTLRSSFFLFLKKEKNPQI